MDIPVSMIVADEDFNARKDLDGKTEEGHTIDRLATSIKESGQLSPVLVAVVKEHPGMYFLISGFRRFAAISRKEKDGGLERTKVRATVYQPTDKKGQPLLEVSIKDLYYLNLIENEARKALNPFERAVRYHELVRKHDESGNAIAKRVTLDPSYVNRLINAMEMHPKLVARWREEWSSGFEGTRLLQTDKINMLTKMKREGSEKQDHESQLAWLDKQLNPVEVDEDEVDEDDNKPETNGHDKRASLSQVKRALAAAEAANKVKASAFNEGVIAALKFAIKPRKIEGVLSIAEGGKVIKGADGKSIAAPKA
jgi:ParB/RepB/Spo0J family partition protein